MAVYSFNCPQFVVATYGALKAGATVVPCSSAYKEVELEHQLNDSGAKVLFTCENLLPIANAPVKETNLEHLIVTSKQDFNT